jgi:steroid 5-alpha reductase family enzyme
MNEILIIILALMIFFGMSWYYSFNQKIFSWVDVTWSTSFILIVLIIKIYNQDFHFRLLDWLYLFWSIRLSMHLSKRILKEGEDRRYQELRKKWKVWYGLNFFLLFEVQALLSVILAIPLLINQNSETSLTSTMTSITLFIIALVGESIADMQLKKFKEDPKNKNQVCQQGLWRYSRHPNYFFEWLIWISFAMATIDSKYFYLSLIPVLIMFWLLTKVTGIPYAEASSLLSKKELYQSYQKTTNAFFPWKPKRLIVFIFLLLLPFSKTFAIGDPMIQVEKMKNVFTSLRADNIHILDDFYAADTHFVDPLGDHHGIESVKIYYKNLYSSVKEIKFDYKDIISNGNTHVLIWKMTLVTKSLNGGQPMTLEGNSYIKFNDQNLVVYHRDYFDMGEFIYEYIPGLSWVIKKIKNRLKGE